MLSQISVVLLSPIVPLFFFSIMLCVFSLCLLNPLTFHTPWYTLSDFPKKIISSRLLGLYPCDTMANQHHPEPSDVPPQLEYAVRKKNETFMPSLISQGENVETKRLKIKSKMATNKAQTLTAWSLTRGLMIHFLKIWNLFINVHRCLSPNKHSQEIKSVIKNVS